MLVTNPRTSEAKANMIVAVDDLGAPDANWNSCALTAELLTWRATAWVPSQSHPHPEAVSFWWLGVWRLWVEWANRPAHVLVVRDCRTSEWGVSSAWISTAW